MRSAISLTAAHLQRVGSSLPSRVQPLSFLLLLLLCVTAASVRAAPAQEGRTVRPLHGPGYEHLDCSACLTVSRALFERLNGTLRDNPSTYLASHRLNRKNQLRRHPYRNSELLVTEVMDNFCRSYDNDERSLRLHPKSKVRLYHQQVWKDATLGVRPSLREDDVYPPGSHDPQWDDYVALRRYQIAKVYSPKDQEALHGMAMLAATPTMCATLIEDFEDEIEELVKLAHNLSDIEYGLCGLPLADEADTVEVQASIRPITNICARTAVLREAAHQDQLRWSQHMRREERRKAKLAEKQKALEKDAEASDEEADGTTTAAENVKVTSVEVKTGEVPSSVTAPGTSVPADAAADSGTDKEEEKRADVDEGDL